VGSTCSICHVRPLALRPRTPHTEAAFERCAPADRFPTQYDTCSDMVAKTIANAGPSISSVANFSVPRWVPDSEGAPMSWERYPSRTRHACLEHTPVLGIDLCLPAQPVEECPQALICHCKHTDPANALTAPSVTLVPPRLSVSWSLCLLPKVCHWTQQRRIVARQGIG
jgi:hypothetical protein